MAVPKSKVSKSKRNTRRAHDGIKKVTISYDSVTGEPKLPHHLSLKDGYYRAKQLVKPKIKNKENGDDKKEKDATSPKVTEEEKNKK